MFENIKILRPYFHSLREVQNNVSLDIKLPLTWTYENIVKPYSSIKTKVQDKNDKYNLISLVSEATQEGYDVVFACANEIMKINKEEEEKQKLFQLKIKELQELFKHESLDKLKEITLLNTNGSTEKSGEDTSSVKLAGQGSEEGSPGDRDAQEDDD